MLATFHPGLKRTASDNAEAHLQRVHDVLIICTHHAQQCLRWWDGDTVRTILLSIKSFGASLRPLITHLVAPHLEGVGALCNLQDLTLGTKMSEGFGALPLLHAHDLQTLAGLQAITRLCLVSTMVEDIQVLASHTALHVLCLAKSKGVSDLSPLHGLGLQQLDLSSTSVADITPLAHMSSLEVLNLSNCASLSTLTPHLPGLQELDLAFTDIIDITPLSAMSNLRTLNLHFVYNVTDFAPIANMHNLHNLNLVQTNIANGDILSGLSHLKVLKLRCRRPEFDLSALQALQLEELHLGCSDLGPLASLRGLRHLDVSFCSELDNASVLASLTRLEALHVSVALRDEVSDVIPELPLTLTNLDLAGVQDLSGVTHLQNLHTLIIQFSHECYDIGPLAQLKSLRWLLLPGAPVEDLGPLWGLPLERLDCSATEVTDLSPLAATSTLTQLACSDCPRLLDVLPLSKLSRLSWLDLSNTSVHDLWPLSRLPLQHLFLAATQVHDLSPLGPVRTLVCLDVSDTPAQDLSPLARLTRLQLLQASGCPAVGVPPPAMRPLRVEELNLFTPYPSLYCDAWFCSLHKGPWLHRDLLAGRDWSSLH